MYTFLNRNDYLYLKVADLVMCLKLHHYTARIRPFNLCKGANLFIQCIFLPMGSNS